MCRRKQVIGVIAAVVFLAVLLTPEIRRYKDEGTVEYHAVIYQVFDWHAMQPGEASNVEKYYEGIEIRIFGRTVFNNAAETEIRYCD